jgi:hypothetical protein
MNQFAGMFKDKRPQKVNQTAREETNLNRD